jgi:diguanylate cyclase (GGDEF)-like protein
MLSNRFEIEDKKLLKELNILYVEDDEYTSESLTSILSKKVNKIYTANNGQEGLELYKNNHIDVILTDIRMPIMTGIEMAREIKSINSNAKVIYVSAHNDQEILLQAIEAGADGFVIKPISVRTKLLFILVKMAKEIYKDKLIKKYNDTLKLILDYVDSIILVSDGKQILEANSSFFDFVNYETLDEFKKEYNCICQKFIVEENFLKPQYSDKIWIDVALENENAKAKMLDKNGLERIFLVKPTPLSSGSDTTYVVNMTDITELEEEREDLFKKASKDALTNIFNRSSFNMFLEKQLNELKKVKEPFSMIFFDIDYFKKINDTYGHQLGDEVLKDISYITNHRLRNSDIFSRWGGEEFIIILPNTNIENSTKVAEELRKSIENFKFKIDKQVTCSFGVIEIKRVKDADEILKDVDKALYRAKENGRNRVEVVE